MKKVFDFNTEDISELKITTKYCVDQATHDAHMKYSMSLGLPPIPVVEPGLLRPEPIAIVCSGPSLADTWEKIKDFKVVLTCSGAHDFLIERGIIPTFHMETDPRKHKAVFTKVPNPSVKYLIASNCHPAVFHNLKNFDVSLWHVNGDHPLHYLPRGHWYVTGGCNVGLRALVVARLLGFTHLHIFGMDCSSSSEKFHVNYHPNEPKKKNQRQVKVGDRVFETSDVFVECARQFLKETMLLADCSTTLYGDGFLQALVAKVMSDPKEVEKRKEWIRTRGGAVIATSLPNTISAGYALLNQQLHKENADYGGHGDRYVKIVRKMAETDGVRTVLDYGCGKGALGRALDFPIWEYDPCIPGKESPPPPADLVVCTDVLEHIEPELLDATLEDLRRVVKFSAFFAIHTSAAAKTLPDGRNTHLIQQNKEWWRARLEKYFYIAYCEMKPDSPVLHVVCGPKQNGRMVKEAA